MQYAVTRGDRDPSPPVHLRGKSGGSCYQNLEKIVTRRGPCNGSDGFELGCDQALAN